MHAAFECVPILERLPLQIDSIATVDKNLLVGTNKGHLLVYEVRENGQQRFDPELQRSNKTFARKPINQMCIIKELELLISLSDGLISIHDYPSFEPKMQLHKSKGTSYFATDLKKNTDDSGLPFQLRICLIVKKKLMLYHWINGEFQELHSDLGLIEIPKSVAWCGDFICCGGRKDYYLIKADTGNIIELFPVGRQPEPFIQTLKSGELALNSDEMTVLLSADKNGKTSQKHAVTWSDIPIDIEFRPPYILAILPKCVEIWSQEPKQFIQKISLPSAKLRAIVQHQSIYVSSQNNVWRLVPVSIQIQIKQLTEDRQFGMALTLVKMMDTSESEKKTKTLQIKTLNAFDMICRKKKFEEAFRLFTELDTDPCHVIGVFPNLLPEDFRKTFDYPYPLPDFSDGDLQQGMHHLTGYLAKVRNRHLTAKGTDKQISTNKMLAQVVDTSLLKCYLQTNEAMIAPLLRVDNNCHVEECERVLKRAKKYTELVSLYQNKGIHKKALDLLLRLADKPSGNLQGHEKTVLYLQKLGPRHLDLIFDYSAGILKKEPDDGLKIFIEDLPEIESLPREKVLSHLETHAPQLILKYLEHIIMDWKESKPEFHNRLVICYKEKIMPLLKEYRALYNTSSRSASLFVKAGKEPGSLGELRSSLLFLLETSTCYQPMALLRYFPSDCLFEERALLLGRAGRHEEALAIYIYILKDTHMAEQYCRRQYEQEREESRDVYLSLLKMYLRPKDLPSLQLDNSIFRDCKMEPNIDAAILIMHQHYQKIDVAQALEMLPSTSQVKDLLVFLNKVLEDKMAQRRARQIFKSLLYSEHLQVHEQRIFYQSKKCAVTDERACGVCHKRIGTSAFARYPNGVIVHYYCCKDRRICPTDLDT